MYQSITMAKAPESSSPSPLPFPAGNRRSNKRVVTAFVSAIGFLVAVGAIVALTTSSGENEFSPIAKLFADAQCTDPCVPGSEDIMKQKDHGTSDYPVQQDLRWGCDWDTADRISNFNRHYAEYAGYWTSTTFLTDYAKNIAEETGQVTFYDSGWKGSPLFTAPRDRTWDDFIQESIKHGWPSFRDSEVDWEYARVLPGGEMVSVDGTHLGHNLPDKSGNRYCINLVSIAGNVPTDENVRHLL